ncbi:hypothetical protein Lal_00043205 [Lupinus albus]|uniref:Putative transcription factor AS2-LOB family n=1 Tax=Lupinus albus TaxID=3870 RepID=A0A6A4N9U1_LUPAL|nr:putative transcription factor AS2-LOB family [Lupinus albus]KAF1864564.1 hypothetical protein Lal_00043205 [Lupinus albus]
MSSSNAPPCAACKHMKRKCTPQCLFAPYFPPENLQRFEQVHKVFGSNNVSKILRELNPCQREDVVKSLVYQAEARLRDPVNGCIGFISELHDRLNQIKTNINNTMEEISTYLGPQAMKTLEEMVQNPSLVPPIGMVIPNIYHDGNFSSSKVNGNINMEASSSVSMVKSHDQLVIQDDQQQPLLEAQPLDTVGKFESGGGSGGGGGSDVSPHKIQQQEGENNILDSNSPHHPNEAQA